MFLLSFSIIVLAFYHVYCSLISYATYKQRKNAISVFIFVVVKLAGVSKLKTTRDWKTTFFRYTFISVHSLAHFAYLQLQTKKATTEESLGLLYKKDRRWLLIGNFERTLTGIMILFCRLGVKFFSPQSTNSKTNIIRICTLFLMSCRFPV